MLTQKFFFQADVYSAERKTYKAKEINIRGRVCVISKVQQTRREKKKIFSAIYGPAFVIGRTGFISIFSGRISPLFPF